MIIPFTLNFIHTQQDYFLMLKIIPDCKIVSLIFEYLVSNGYIEIVSRDLLVKNVLMSTRLKNILLRNNIFYLPQLSAYPIEIITGFRNLGQVALTELKNLCIDYNVEIRSIQSIKNILIKIRYNKRVLCSFFNHEVITSDDFRKQTIYDIYIMCREDIHSTILAYDSLRENGIELKKWEDIFLFEFMPYKKAERIIKQYNIKTVGELCTCPRELIEKMGITCVEMHFFESLLKKHQRFFDMKG